jgi:hypothetical protein
MEILFLSQSMFILSFHIQRSVLPKITANQPNEKRDGGDRKIGRERGEEKERKMNARGYWRIHLEEEVMHTSLWWIVSEMRERGERQWDSKQEREGGNPSIYTYTHSFSPSLSLSPSLPLSINRSSERADSYIILIVDGSIPQQNLHNIYFSIASCVVQWSLKSNHQNISLFASRINANIPTWMK